MSPEAQRIAIAEACGWKHVFEYKWLHEYGKEGEDVWCPLGGICPETKEDAPLPDYLNDLNAMHEAEKALTTMAQQQQYASLLRSMTDPQSLDAYSQDFLLLHATAAQRAEAFLRATGRWDEAQ